MLTIMSAIMSETRSNAIGNLRSPGDRDSGSLQKTPRNSMLLPGPESDQEDDGSGVAMGKFPRTRKPQRINRSPAGSDLQTDNSPGDTIHDSAGSPTTESSDLEEPGDSRAEFGADILLGVVLGAEYRVDRLIRQDNHSNIYAITCESDMTGPPDAFEARAFSMDGLDKKLIQYRQRNMRRLRNRSLWAGTVNGRNVIVYRKDSLNDADGQSGAPQAAAQDSCRPKGRDLPNSRVYGPTPAQGSKDSARMRQQRRRTRQREAQRSATGDDPPETGDHADPGGETGSGRPGTSTGPQRNPNAEERTLNALLGLHGLMQDRNSRLANISPPRLISTGGDASNHAQALAGMPACLGENPLGGIKITTMQELGSLAAAKQEEAKFLQTLQAKLPPLHNKKTKHYLNLCGRKRAIHGALWGDAQEAKRIAALKASYVNLCGRERATHGALWGDAQEAQRIAALKVSCALGEVGDFVAELREKAELSQAELTRRWHYAKQEHRAWHEGGLGEDGDLPLRQMGGRQMLGILVPYTPVYNKVQAEVEALERAARNRDPTTTSGLFWDRWGGYPI
ncbi:hypothetical protein B0T25DRAFT_322497 [Lasiosphaeria hispida]|uniref:Uncharacterized protein n=1 Tax=Lasiosphaeria hispida TaxID=260671 RepID=A0AAJ0M9X1_9PEZI|nr:hypothetical protein B0T25DRAFT_322497 [Lasiosphaeria hispida]